MDIYEIQERNSYMKDGANLRLNKFNEYWNGEYMIIIREVIDDCIKSDITKCILSELPEWFGNEQSLLNYVETVKGKAFYCAYDGDNAIGFISLKFNNPYTTDIYVIGILKKYHRKGIGKQLIEATEQYIKSKGFKFLMVKTLGETSDYEFYKNTRKFYKSVGFYPLEEFKEIWDEDNPCLIMVKSLE